MSPVVRRVLVALFSFILLVQATPTPHSAIKHHLLNPSKRDTVANHFIARYHDNVTDEAIERHRRLLEGVLETRRRSPSLGFTPRIDMIQIGDMRALDLRVDHDMIPVIAQAPEVRFLMLASFLRLMCVDQICRAICYQDSWGNRLLSYSSAEWRLWPWSTLPYRHRLPKIRPQYSFWRWHLRICRRLWHQRSS